MLRSVFAVQNDRLAVAFEGGDVLEVGDADSNGKYTAQTLTHARDVSNSADAGKKSAGVGTVVDIAYSAGASAIATVTEDKRVWVWQASGGVPREGEGVGMGVKEWAEIPDTREIPKKPTSVLFAPTGAGSNGKEVLVMADKCGDAYAAPLPDPSAAFKHLLGHTAMTITAMVSLKGGSLLATADRAEHIRVSHFPRTSIVHTYLLGHKDFVSALAAVSGEGVMLVSGGGDGMVGLWDADSGEGIAMISVRQACQDLADGDMGNDNDDDHQDNDNATDTHAAAVTTVKPPSSENPTDHRQQQNVEDDDIDVPSEGVAEMRVEGEAGTRARQGGAASGLSDGEQAGAGLGVPLNISCSEDGTTVAVVISGLKGLLLLSLEHAGVNGRASLTPRARLQLPTVPIQAGFLGGDLVVALPSSASDECMRAFHIDSREGPVPAGESSVARAKCSTINATAKELGTARPGEYILKTAVPDEDASEALGGGLRKHKGVRGEGKSPDSWNNFSKRRDKNQEKKRKRLLYTPRPPTTGTGDNPDVTPGSEAVAAT